MAVMMSKYCQNVTLNHKVAQEYIDCVQSIDCICREESFHEGKKKCCDVENITFGDAQAINLDCVMRKEKPILASVDIIIGLNNKRYVGIELKLNVKKVPINDSQQLKRKRCNTLKKLKCQENNMDFVLIYCRTSKAENYLHRIQRERNPPKHGYEIMFLEDFKTKFW